jgi:hypothetical protein
MTTNNAPTAASQGQSENGSHDVARPPPRQTVPRRRFAHIGCRTNTA